MFCLCFLFLPYLWSSLKIMLFHFTLTDDWYRLGTSISRLEVDRFLSVETMNKWAKEGSGNLLILC